MATLATLRPFWGNCLIRPIAQPKKTQSGLVLPDTAPKGNVLQGTVIAVGKGSLALDGSLIPMEITEGAIVLFRKYEAELVPFGEEELYLVDQRQVMAAAYK